MRNQISSLTSTRGFAALAVVIFHFGHSIAPFNKLSIFKSGNLAVSYFFVLSGFVMYLSYYKKRIVYADYMKRRVARIVPLYLLAILLCITPWIIICLTTNKVLSTDFIPALLTNVLFIQAYFPQYIYSINTPGWSLCSEMLFYLIFPAMLWFSEKKIKYFIIATYFFFMVSQVVHLYLVYNWHSIDAPKVIYYNPIFHLNQFLIGMTGGYFYYKYRETKIRIPALLWLILAFVLIQLVYINTSLHFISFHNGLLAPIFLIFIVTVAIKDPIFLQNKILVYFGEISYGIYLLQKPVHYYVYDLLKPKFSTHQDTFIFYLFLLALIITSIFSYQFFEKPMRNKINSLGRKND